MSEVGQSAEIEAPVARTLEDLTLRELADVATVWMESPPGTSDRGVWALYVERTMPQQIQVLLDEQQRDRSEAERLRTGLRCLIRDWSEGWEDCTPFDQRDAYRALTALLGPDYDTERTWVAPVNPPAQPTQPGTTP